MRVLRSLVLSMMLHMQSGTRSSTRVVSWTISALGLHNSFLTEVPFFDYGKVR